MSKIQNVQPTYQPNVKQKSTNFAQNPSFGGGFDADQTKKIVDVMEKKIVGRVGRFGGFLAKNDSEIEKQLINAVFTATLAPIVIGWNPFSRQDEKTKKYMALRQPISAVIAIAGGISLTKPIDDWLAQMGSTGFVPSLDMRMSPDKAYLGAKFNNAYKEAKKDPQKLEKFVEKWTPEDLDKKAKKDGSFMEKRRFQKACREKYVKNEQENAKKIFTTLISENPKDITINENQEILLNGKKFAEKIPNMATKEQLEDYLNKNSLYKKSFGDFMKENLGFEFYADHELKPDTTKTKLIDTKAIEFLRSIGFTPKKDGFGESELVKAMGILRDTDQTIGQLEEAYSGCSSKPDFIKLSNAHGQQSASATKALMGEKAADAESYTLNQLFHRLGYEGVDKQGKNILQEKMKKPTSDILTEIAVKLKRAAAESKDGKDVAKYLENKTLSDFAKNIMNGKVEKMATHFKTFKGYFGILSNLFIVAATCTVLNWVYPRLVERLFPRLVKTDESSDVQKGGNK